MALTDNINAYYKLDESSGDAIDSVGSYDLTNTGSAAYAAGLINNGVDFGTTNTTKALSRASNLGITGYSASFSTWKKLAQEIPSSYYAIIHYRNSVSSVIQYFVLFYEYNGGTPRLNLYVNGTANYYTVTLGTTFHHFVVIRKSTGQYELWLDNVKVISSVTIGSDHGGAEYFSLGYNYDLNISAPGISDETAVYSREITSDEVTSLYNSGVGLQYPFASTNTGAFFQFFN